MSNKNYIGKCDWCGKQNTQIKIKEIECGAIGGEYSYNHKFNMNMCKDCLSKSMLYNNKSIIQEEKSIVKYTISEMERSDIYDSVEDLIEDYICSIIPSEYDEEEVKEISYIKNGKRYLYLDIDTVKPYEDYISAEDIIEKLSEEAYDEYDGADDYLQGVNTEWLQEQLDKIWKEFKVREKIEAPFYQTQKTEEYRVYFEGDKVLGYELSYEKVKGEGE